MKKYEELLNLIENLEKIFPIYQREVKDLISRTIVIENQLTRLNHQLHMIRNFLDKK